MAPGPTVAGPPQKSKMRPPPAAAPDSSSATATASAAPVARGARMPRVSGSTSASSSSSALCSANSHSDNGSRKRPKPDGIASAVTGMPVMLLRERQSRLGGTPGGMGPLTERSRAPAPQPSIAWMRSGGYSSPSPRKTQERPHSAAAPSSCSATVAPKVSSPTRASSGSSAAACAAADTASARSAAGTAVSITNKKAEGVENGGGGSVYSTQQY